MYVIFLWCLVVTSYDVWLFRGELAESALADNELDHVAQVKGLANFSFEVVR